MKERKLYEATDYKNIKEIIYNSAEKYNDKTAFIIKHKEEKEVTYENVSYTRLLEDINKFGTYLYEIGFQGKRIAIIGKNQYGWFLTHLTNMLGQIISVPLDKDLEYDELENSLVRAKVDGLVFDEKLAEMVDGIRKNGKTTIKQFISMDNLDGYKYIEECIKKGKELLDNGKNEYVNCKIDDNAMNVLLFKEVIWYDDAYLDEVFSKL